MSIHPFHSQNYWDFYLLLLIIVSNELVLASITYLLKLLFFFDHSHFPFRKKSLKEEFLHGIFTEDLMEGEKASQAARDP